MASDPVVDVILIFYPDKVCSPPDFRDVFSHMIWSWVIDVEGIVGQFGIIEAMAILLDAARQIALKPQCVP